MGKGRMDAKTIEDAKQMADDFARKAYHNIYVVIEYNKNNHE